MAIPESLTLDQVVAALETSIEEGAWLNTEGICGHCYYVGSVYEANAEVLGPLPPDPVASCKECLVHRSLWDSYLENNP